MSKTHFVVTETSFEYNDEYHRVVDGGGGKPVAIFDNEKDANDDVAKRNIQAIKEYGEDMISGFIYGYGPDYVFKTLPSFLEEDDYDCDSIRDALDIKNRTHDELVELEACMNVKFFSWTKV